MLLVVFLPTLQSSLSLPLPPSFPCTNHQYAVKTDYPNLHYAQYVFSLSFSLSFLPLPYISLIFFYSWSISLMSLWNYVILYFACGTGCTHSGIVIAYRWSDFTFVRHDLRVVDWVTGEVVHDNYPNLYRVGDNNIYIVAVGSADAWHDLHNYLTKMVSNWYNNLTLWNSIFFFKIYVFFF